MSCLQPPLPLALKVFPLCISSSYFLLLFNVLGPSLQVHLTTEESETGGTLFPGCRIEHSQKKTYPRGIGITPQPGFFFVLPQRIENPDTKLTLQQASPFCLRKEIFSFVDSLTPPSLIDF